jgi:hypothetical protein
MSPPTLADVDGDKIVEIIISLKDVLDGSNVGGVQIWDVASSGENLLPWPTGRGNNLRTGLSSDLEPSVSIINNPIIKTGTVFIKKGSVVRLYNMKGQLVLERVSLTDKHFPDLKSHKKDLSTGIYFTTVIYNKKLVFRKFIIVK